jgi:prepilin-type N-terminal cleavage/methylation domain-containing protein
MAILRPRALRKGMSLLEVLIALTIFLMSMIVLGQLVIMAGESARNVQLLAQATQMCQSKLAEVTAGIVPLSSQGETPFDEDSDWNWSLDCTSDPIANLWDVTVHVSHALPDGSRLETSLSQRVLDPSVRGSTFDTPAASQSSTTGAAAPAATTGGN